MATTNSPRLAPAPGFRPWVTYTLVWAGLAFAAAAAWCAFLGGPVAVAIVAAVQWFLAFQAWWRGTNMDALLAHERARRGP